MAVHKVDIGDFEPFEPLADAALPDLEFVPIDQLIIDDRYQRSVANRGKSNIVKIAHNFDWSKFSPVVLSRREDGTFAIIDGQHRTHAAALRGITTVPALITNMTIEQEASAFSWVNGAVTALTPNQVFKAALTAFEPWAVMCDATVAKAGCRLMPFNRTATQKKPGEVFCVTKIRHFVAAGSAAQVTTALQAIRNSEVSEVHAYYNAKWLAALVTAVISSGVTRPEPISDFLNRQDFDRITRLVNKVHDQPENRGRSHLSLFTDSVKVLLRKHLADNA